MGEDIKLGLIVRADNTGLGVQTYNYYKYLKPYRTMVIDISELNGNQQFPDRYPDAWRTTKGFPKYKDCNAFLDGLDAVLTVEIPYNYYLFERARELGIKTYLQYNWEFLDYLQRELPYPDFLLAPSRWNLAGAQALPCKVIQIPVPVDTEVIKPRSITKAKTFVHIVGKPATHDRNGTDTLLNAIKYIQSDITLQFRCQDDRYIDYIKNVANTGSTNVKIEFKGEIENYYDAFNEGDVLVMPRKFGGLCLPMQEALAAGMPVIMTEMSPNYFVLPTSWLVRARYKTTFMTRTEIDVYEADEKQLAQKIDEFASMSEPVMENASTIAKRIAEGISWKTLLPVYEALVREK